jgi:integrase
MIRAAAVRDATTARRFVAVCVFLLGTGCRSSEALGVRLSDVDLRQNFAFCGKTKNGLPRAVDLPPAVVAELANIEFGDERAFGISAKCGRLQSWLDEIATAADVVIPERVAFHIFRQTWAKWMRRYGGLDTSGLVATGAWRSRAGAAVYEHVETTEEARRPTTSRCRRRGR